MKKLMAWLMAALLLALPMQAMANGAQTLTLTMETDAARLSPLVTALVGKDNPGLCEDLAKLINTCVFESCWQDDATWTSFALDGETLLKIAAANTGDKDIFVISMVPGYALETAAQPQLDWDALSRLDLTEEAALLMDRLSTLSDSLEWTEETGSFLGDAYEGGVRRVTCLLDDRTVYLLAECFLTTMEGSETFAREAGVPAEEIFSSMAQLREALLPGALENAYSYRLSLVYDEHDEIIGLSLTALEGDKQVSTLSVGSMEDGLEAVWGYGRNGVNYYLRLTLLAEESGDGMQALGMRLSVIEDPVHLGYALASCLEDTTVEEHILSMAYGTVAESILFSGEYEVTTPAGSMTLSWDGDYAAEPFSLNAVADVYETGSEQSVVTLRLTTGECAALTVDTEGLTVVDIDNMDADTEAEMDDAITQAATDLGLSLFRMIPAELLMLLVE